MALQQPGSFTALGYRDRKGKAKKQAVVGASIHAAAARSLHPSTSARASSRSSCGFLGNPRGLLKLNRCSEGCAPKGRHVRQRGVGVWNEQQGEDAERESRAVPIRKNLEENAPPLHLADPSASTSAATSADTSASESRRPAVHFIGMGGAGLSALAALALHQGWRVSGSDIADSWQLRRLEALGATVFVGHSSKHISDVHSASLDASTAINGSDLPGLAAVVASSAIPPENSEMRAAKFLGIPVYTRGEWLGMITAGSDLVAIAGSHGKSTTTAMLSVALLQQPVHLTAIVGALVPQFPDGSNVVMRGSSNSNGKSAGSSTKGSGNSDSSKVFVLEADEYHNCFHSLSPKIAIVTNVEWEHVDVFRSEDEARSSFRKFVRRLLPGGVLILCSDDAGSRSLSSALSSSEAEETKPAERGKAAADDELLQLLMRKSQQQKQLQQEEQEGGRAAWLDEQKERRVVTYGVGERCEWRAVMLSPNVVGGTDFVAVFRNRPMARVSLTLPGAHNVLNALAAIVAAAELAAQNTSLAGDDDNDSKLIAVYQQAAAAAATALASFSGAKRRFELVGSCQNGRVVVVDDYAHHPTEVRAVLQAARQRFDTAKIWVVFQPHTFSRLHSLMDDFAPSFSAADRVIVTEVYAARESNLWGVSSQQLVAAVTGPPAVFVESLDDVVSRLSWEIGLLETDQEAAAAGWPPSVNVVILTLGAGDVTSVGPRLLEALRSKE